jgi:mannose/fructose-specific phosphotransferase system component IIA
MSVCSQTDGGTVLNAAVTLIRDGLRRGSVAGLQVTALPERGKERALTSLAHELTAAAADWLREEPPLGVLPVFVYP